MKKGILILALFVLSFYLVSGEDVRTSCGGPTQCNCGDMLSGNHVMDYDLGPCNSGLYIWGGVDLDCNGHKIFSFSDSFEGSGLMINTNNAGTIKNCEIVGFIYGIIGNIDNGVIENNSIHGNIMGIGLYGSDGFGDNVSVLRNSLTGNGQGIEIRGSSEDEVMGNIFFNNTIALSSEDAEKNIIQNNTFFNNSDYALLLNTNSNYNRIMKNNFSNNGNSNSSEYGAISLYQAKQNYVFENTFDNNLPKNLWVRQQYSTSEPPYAVHNLIFDNDFYYTDVYDENRSNNGYCASGVANNYYEGSIGPSCEVKTSVECGEAVYKDVLLENDLIDCEWGPFLSIANDYLTFNCNNHILDGLIIDNSMGILVGHLDYFNLRNVTLKNCRISDVEIGVYLEGDNNIIFNNTIINSQWGIGQYGGKGTSFIENTFTNLSYGIRLSNAHEIRINSNIFEHLSQGIYFNNVQDSSIVNNSFIQNEISAYEDSGSNNNHWNNSEIGNYWDDFEENPGYPEDYKIFGEGNGIDYHPIWNFAPSLQPIPDIQVNELAEVIIIPNATDEDDDELTYSINDNRFIWKEDIQGFEWKTNETDSGDYVFTITVSDGNLEDYKKVSVRVKDTCFLEPTIKKFICAFPYQKLLGK